MNIEQVREYTLSLYGVTEDQPFGDDIITFRLEGKIFVCLWLGGCKHDMKNSEPRLALKLTREERGTSREVLGCETRLALEQKALERRVLRTIGRYTGSEMD